MKVSSAAARRQAIVDKVNQSGFVAVDALAASFATSEVTIRKDLTVLAEQGAVVRQLGGAAPVPQVGTASPAPVDAKQHLGEAAAALVAPHQKLVVDCGTTVFSVVPQLARHAGLIVMTNSLAVANVLTDSEAEPTVLMTGGTWDAHSQSFQGAMAEQLVSAYSFDIAFIGASGIDVARGTTTFNELTGLTRAMADAADKVVVMAESSKLRNKMPNVELAWDRVSVLISDDGLPDADRQRIEQQGVDVIIAAPKGV
ncbi:DeoR family transcriptional regulator [Alteromonas sp. ASW11-19]|uniref:DeoR family transcriptional regulator n=1 Tax=Alteromonas salexigens TaxID=2982530 RepID=A0ABT2VKW3_9ALTE|nr:DeoR family transcriptional regulator [Alteromonas salexigens]MCU7553448.1 DeoR family transcriptional regulator [Alteromonas salexigens]